jgi:hypothetical protein
MALDTVILQGRFTADGDNKTIALRSDWDWMRVYNETVMYAAGNDDGAEFYFQRGMTDGRGVVYAKEATIGALVPDEIAANSGFFYVDSSIFTQTARAALTAMTAANPAVVTSAGHGLSVGDIVRFDNMDNQPQIAGMDFTVTASGATFTIGNINLVNSTASTAGFWRRISFDPIFYPRRRFVTYVSSEVQCKVYLSVTHGYTVGQKIRLQFPGGSTVWGDYAVLDGRSATILSINATRAGNEPNNGGVANNIVLDVDTSTFTAWNASFGAALNQAYPAAADVPFSNAQVVPFGEDTAYALSQNVDILQDATRNTAILGVTLQAGALSPAGVDGDVIYWIAGKSFSDEDEV